MNFHAPGHGGHTQGNGGTDGSGGCPFCGAKMNGKKIPTHIVDEHSGGDQ